MNIDFIKWMVGYAKGFRFGSREYHDQWNIYFNDYHVFGCTALEAIRHFVNDDHYIILLQKAIEGINKDSSFLIKQENIIQVCKKNNTNGWSDVRAICLTVTQTFDQAKEQALKYVWEQEKK